MGEIFLREMARSVAKGMMGRNMAIVKAMGGTIRKGNVGIVQ